jgi:hypothetical protein
MERSLFIQSVTSVGESIQKIKERLEFDEKQGSLL